MTDIGVVIPLETFILLSFLFGVLVGAMVAHLLDKIAEEYKTFKALKAKEKPQNAKT